MEYFILINWVTISQEEYGLYTAVELCLYHIFSFLYLLVENASFSMNAHLCGLLKIYLIIFDLI